MRQSIRNRRSADVDDPFEWRTFHDHLWYQRPEESRHLLWKFCYSFESFLIKNLWVTQSVLKSHFFHLLLPSHLNRSRCLPLRLRCHCRCRVDPANRLNFCYWQSFDLVLSKCLTGIGTPNLRQAFPAVDVPLPARRKSFQWVTVWLSRDESEKEFHRTDNSNIEKQSKTVSQFRFALSVRPSIFSTDRLMSFSPSNCFLII